VQPVVSCARHYMDLSIISSFPDAGVGEVGKGATMSLHQLHHPPNGCDLQPHPNLAGQDVHWATRT
jgi:hypothetical protein